MKARRRSLTYYLIVAVLLVVLGYLIFLVIGIFQKEEVARRSAMEKRQEVAELEERRAILLENLRELETERGREAAYRDQFGVARPGEEVIIVISAPIETPQTGLSWWRKLLSWFGL